MSEIVIAHCCVVRRENVVDHNRTRRRQWRIEALLADQMDASDRRRAQLIVIQSVDLVTDVELTGENSGAGTLVIYPEYQMIRRYEQRGCLVCLVVELYVDGEKIEESFALHVNEGVDGLEDQPIVFVTDQHTFSDSNV